MAWFCRSTEQEILRQRTRLFRLAYAWCGDRDMAEDLVQEAIARALATTSPLKEPRALEGWLMVILNNCWRDCLRKKMAGVLEDIDDWAERLESEELSPEQNLAGRQTAITVRKAIARLPLGQRQVLTLVDMEDRSYAEVAEILGVPAGTVMSRLARARAALKELLTDVRPAAQAANLRRVK
jgi:RNA polymerase sigma-70 factor (ECF subfamily)